MYTPRIVILLSSYNGALFLPEQLDSILNQTTQHWMLLARDDGSMDQTISILHQYAERDPRIRVVNDDLGNLGVIKSFSKLLHGAIEHEADYVFFCDQDDVWVPEKIERQMQSLFKMEKEYGKQEPILVYTDARVVDAQLSTISDSFLDFEKLRPSETGSWIHTLVVDNVAAGCTMAINRALLNRVYPIPDEALMHDWWAALCASACGRILFLNHVTVLYRQHGFNNVGSRGLYGTCLNWKNAVNRLKSKRKKFFLSLLQARCVLERIPEHHPHFAFLYLYSNVMNQSCLRRIQTMLKLRLKPTHCIRAILYWVFVAWG